MTIDLDRANDPPFVLLLTGEITLTAVWQGSRWAWWKAGLAYAGYDSGYGFGRLHGKLVADQHAQPGPALDALLVAAHVLGVNLDYGTTPTLYLHAYSTDGTPVRYPRGAALVRAQAARLGWQAGGYPRPARRA